MKEDGLRRTLALMLLAVGLLTLGASPAGAITGNYQQDFAHSYVAETPTASATSEGIVAEARFASFVGVQFHPEKSGAAGARFLKRCLSPV